MRGTLYLFEGMDGVGKATHSKQFVKDLEARGLHAMRWDFPNYETTTGKAILLHLKNKWSAREEYKSMFAPTSLGLDATDNIDALVFQALMTVNRYEVAKELDTLLNRGVNVVLDRYWPSGYAYGKADGLSEDWLLAVHSSLPRVDKAVLLDITPEESIRRRPERRDRYEKQPGLMETVRANYLELFACMKRGAGSWNVVDAMGSFDEVHSRVVSSLLEEA